MNIVHLEIELNFADEFHSHSVSQQLFERLTGKQSSDLEEVSEPGVDLRWPKKKLFLAWKPDSCTAVVELIPNPQDGFTKIISLMETINEIVPIGNIRKHLITHWIFETEISDFKELEQKYRNIMVVDHPMWTKAFDSSVIMDLKLDKCTLHHQSGAMKLNQLNQEYLTFKVEGIPKIFLFLWVSIYEDRITEYSTENIMKFLPQAFSHCKKHADEVDSIWRGKL